MKTYIIAEAGVNHNGSLDMAMKLVDVATQAGADAVKFQIFKTENLVTKSAKQASYQIENYGDTNSQFNMLKKLELSYDDFIEIKRYCEYVGIEFLATPFDFESADFLIDELNISEVKVSSGDLTNIPFLHYLATKGKPIILSTGMSNETEIHDALKFMAFGFLYPNEVVDVNEVEKCYVSKEAKQMLSEKVKILHCTTQYPSPVKTINLNAMKTIKDTFGIEIGLSDHSEGIHISVAAVALGATVIEKHFTLDKTLEGPDHLASLAPNELEQLVKHIRDIEVALGDGNKLPHKEELQNADVVRKSLVAKRKIQAGELFSHNNLTIKRPGSGISPLSYWSYIGKRAINNYEEDQLINE